MIPGLRPHLSTTDGDATSPSGLRSPCRALLHALLLRGLRPPRLAHDSGWSSARQAGCTLFPFTVRGARGQALAAWLARPQAPWSGHAAPVVVGVHGWGANASTLVPMLDPLMRAGFAVVLFDAASHGDSTAEAYSSLPRFAEDLAAVLAALEHLPGLDLSRLGLLGHSLGAAAVLLHSARKGGVRAVISLSAFAHPQELMERWLQDRHIPRRWIGSAILNHVQSVIGERFHDIAPLHQLPKLSCPVLLVHGEHDRTVPLTDALRLRAALKQGELLVVDADHDLRPTLAPQAERLVQFFATHLDAIPK